MNRNKLNSGLRVVAGLALAVTSIGSIGCDERKNNCPWDSNQDNFLSIDEV